MPRDLKQTAYSIEGWKALVKKLQNRIEAVRPAIQKLGGKIESAWFTFDGDAVCYKDLVVAGSNASFTPAWRRALRFLTDKKIDTKRQISHRFSVANWDQALDVAKYKALRSR